MSAYQTIGDGDVLCLADQPDEHTNATLVLACCDCGLVHEVIIGRDNTAGETKLVWKTNGRRTYMKRRWMRERKQGIFAE